MLKVGVIGFGGGSALIPVMERELVNDRGGLRERDFVRDTVIANITPGALPVKLAALAGVRLGGAGLSVVSAFAVALLTVALLAFFATLGPGGIRVVEGLSLGVTSFILFLLAHYALKVLRPGGRWRLGGLAIAVLVFAVTGGEVTMRLIGDLFGVDALGLPHLSALGVILVALAAVGVVSFVQGRGASVALPTDDDGPSVRVAAGAGLFAALAGAAGVAGAVLVGGAAAFVGLIALSTVSSFGGGEAYVAVADGFFVAPGIVESAEFYGQIVPVANALPGPILVKIAAGMGYSVGAALGGPATGVALAAVATVVSVASCAAIAVAVLGGYDAARRSRFVRNVSAVILPVVCGLLASTAVAMLHASAGIAERSGLPPVPVVVGSGVLAAIVGLLHGRLRVPDPVMIAACAVLSLVVVLGFGA